LHKFYHADRNVTLVENQDIVLDENKLSRFGAEYFPVLSQGNIEKMNEAQKREFFLDEIRKEQEFHLYTSRLKSIFAANSINDAIMFAHAVTPIPDTPINIIEIYAENFWSLDMNWLDYKNDHNTTMSHYRNYWRARITNHAPQQGERRAPRIEVLVALPAKTGKIVHQVMPPNQSKHTDAASCVRV
jgi:hypothetical protein